MKEYYSLTKPGVLYGNALTALAGFLLASAHEGFFSWELFFGLNIGMTLVIASACVINNVLDQDIDQKMERTKKRALIRGTVPGRNAAWFGTVLGVLGVGILYLFTNLPATVVAILGFIVYVWLYGMLGKRLSMHGTLVGSISGAMPILAGYMAVSGALDLGAVIVFFALFLWQQPEFYSIAIYRREEYRTAGIPVMPVVVGVKNTIIQIFCYAVAFVIVSLLLTVFGYTGYTYFVVMGLLGLYFIWLGFKGFQEKDSDAWARKMFHFSLVMILVFSVMLSIGGVLP
ncbi:MAG TPA: heme o synthase [Candidatus Paceibacterota bacterium]|nr:heme o synthase [Candidatus Paceibacterota bacterium]